MDTLSSTRTTGNFFLDALSPSARDTILPSLERVALHSGDVIYELGQGFDAVVFPVSAVISVVMYLPDGSSAEVGIIGRDGMSGLMMALGQPKARQRCVVQVADGGLRMNADAFLSVLAQSQELQSIVRRYAEATLVTTAQLSACNTLHHVNKRCARWLLMAHDRVEADNLLLTQEFLGQMLGARRGSVNLAAGALHDAGLITYSRGRISVLDRAGLEAASCECYRLLDEMWMDIMGYSVRKHSG